MMPRGRAAALGAARRRLAAAGIETPDLDARLLLAAALGGDRLDLALAPERALARAQRDAFARMIARRAAREPVARILGRRGFWRADFAIDGAVLDPRPDSETVIAAALAAVSRAPRAPRTLLDLGTGSGCLLLSLLAEWPAAWGLGIDRSPAALILARANARRLGLARRAAFVAADWTQTLRQPFDVIVCNPPYIASDAIAGLAPEVREHDPRLALDGGPDGLAASRAVLAALAPVLARDSVVVLECGQGQADALATLAAANGLATMRIVSDLGGIERAVVMRPGDGSGGKKQLDKASGQANVPVDEAMRLRSAGSADRGEKVTQQLRSPGAILGADGSGA